MYLQAKVHCICNLQVTQQQEKEYYNVMRLKVNGLRGLGRWFSGLEHWSLSQRTQVWFRHMHGSSRLSVIPVLGDPTPSSDLRALGMHIVYMDTCRQNIHMHKISNFFKKVIVNLGKQYVQQSQTFFCIFRRFCQDRFFNFIFVQVSMYTCQGAHVEITGQLVVVDCFLPPCWSQDLNPCPQACGRHLYLATPRFFILYLVLMFSLHLCVCVCTYAHHGTVEESEQLSGVGHLLS